MLRHQKGTFSAFIIRLAIGATALSVAVMILSMAFIGGFKHVIREKLFAFWGEVLIVPFDPNSSDIAAGLPVQWDEELVTGVGAMAGVAHIYPFALRPAIIQSAGEMEGVRLKGVTPKQGFPKDMAFTGGPIQFEDTAYAQQVILSRSTAARLNIKVGEVVKLYFITTGAPRIRKLEVVGTYHTGMEEVDRQFALCDIRLVQHLSGWTRDEISGYQVELQDNRLADSMTARIDMDYVMRPMVARSIPEVYEGVFSWLGTQDTNGRILLIIVGIVAMINLASSMLILMVDRAVMIALLKTLGMGPRALWALFLSLASLIGGAGILLGNLLGLGLCLVQWQTGFVRLPEETYNMDTVPIRILWWQVALLDVGTLLLCVACAALPLLYIRRVQPARVLQFE